MSNLIVVLPNSKKCHEYKGNMEAGPLPGNSLLVSERVPDVSGKSKEGYVVRPRAIYNSNAWKQVVMGDEHVRMGTDPVDHGITRLDSNSDDTE